MKFPLAVILACCMAAAGRAQTTQSQPAQRLAQPMVIPAAQNAGERQSAGSVFQGQMELNLHLPATASAVQAAPASAPAQSNDDAPQSNTPVPESSRPLAVHRPVADDGLLGGPVLALEKTKPTAARRAPKTPTRAEQNKEMVVRMRLAVEQIAAEYGSPTFAQVFTNDPLQAQILRKRVQLLYKMEEIDTEIAALEKQKSEAKLALDATRRELLVLQQQAQTLMDRLSKAHVALSMAR